jgi:hypothetical protein
MLRALPLLASLTLGFAPAPPPPKPADWIELIHTLAEAVWFAFCLRQYSAWSLTAKTNGRWRAAAGAAAPLSASERCPGQPACR